MSSAAATSLICTPGKQLSFTAVALNFSPYFAIFRGPAFATTHPRAVSSWCQLNRGKLGVRVSCEVRPHLRDFASRNVRQMQSLQFSVSPLAAAHRRGYRAYYSISPFTLL